MKHETKEPTRETKTWKLPENGAWKEGQVLKDCGDGTLVWVDSKPGDPIFQVGGEVPDCLEGLKKDFPREPGVVLYRDEDDKLAWGKTGEAGQETKHETKGSFIVVSTEPTNEAIEWIFPWKAYLPYKYGFRDGALYGSCMTLFAVLVLYPLVRGVWRAFKGAKNGTGS